MLLQRDHINLLQPVAVINVMDKCHYSSHISQGRVGQAKPKIVWKCYCVGMVFMGEAGGSEFNKSRVRGC